MSTVTREYQGTELPVAGEYVIDPAHSSVELVVRHLMISKVRGKLAVPAGSFTVTEDPAVSSVDITLDPSSIDTGEEARDAHLRSPDFFDVETYPTMRFVSNAVRHLKGDRWQVDGELTIKDVTRPVTLDLEYRGALQDPWGNTKLGLAATTELEREQWGLGWNQVLEGGGVVVGKTVKVEIEIEAALQAPQA